MTESLTLLSRLRRLIAATRRPVTAILEAGGILASPLRQIEDTVLELEETRENVHAQEKRFNETELRHIAAIHRLIRDKDGEEVETLKKLIAQVQALQERRRPFGCSESIEEEALNRLKDAATLFKGASVENFEEMKAYAIECADAHRRVVKENRRLWGKYAQDAVNLWEKIENAKKKVMAS